MKAKIHIPTEEYGFIEVEYETHPENHVDVKDFIADSILYYEAAKAARNADVGLNQKDWAKVRDNYILKGEIHAEDVELCSRAQRYVINEIKKSLRKYRD